MELHIYHIGNDTWHMVKSILINDNWIEYWSDEDKGEWESCHLNEVVLYNDKRNVRLSNYDWEKTNKNKAYESRPVWKMAGHKIINMSDMTDSHIINSILKIRSVAQNKIEADIDAGFAMYMMVQGEMATESIDSGLSDLQSATIEQYLEETNPILFTKYNQLIQQAEERLLELPFEPDPDIYDAIEL